MKLDFPVSATELVVFEPRLRDTGDGSLNGHGDGGES
jgi:hypothetical protein